MTDQTVNIPLLRKAVEWAEAEAAKPEGAWHQSLWATLDAPCGTSYCMAGYVMHLSGWDDAQIAGNPATATAAAERLGIPPYWRAIADRTDHLFKGTNTIADVRRIAEDLAGERL